MGKIHDTFYSLQCDKSNKKVPSKNKICGRRYKLYKYEYEFFFVAIIPEIMAQST
jgi:hypothetical protein